MILCCHNAVFHNKHLEAVYTPTGDAIRDPLCQFTVVSIQTRIYLASLYWPLG